MKNGFFFKGYYGNNNLGDELLLQNILNKISKEKENCEIYFLCRNIPQIQLKRGVKFKIVSPRNYFSFVSSLYKSKMLILTGGHLVSDSNIYYYTLIFTLASLLNTEVIIFPIGISKIDKRIKRWLLRKFWLNVKYVSVRDYSSYKNIDWYSRVELKPDVAFLPPPRKIVLTKKVISIGLNPRNVNDIVNKKIRDYFLKLAAVFEKNPILYIYSTSVGQKNNQDDSNICVALQKELINSGFRAEFKSFNNVEELKKFQSKLDFNFACRLHAFLGSLILGIPSYILKIEEVPKIQSIIEFLKFENLMLNLNSQPNLPSILSTDFDDINKKVLSHHNDITNEFEKLITHA